MERSDGAQNEEQTARPTCQVQWHAAPLPPHAPSPVVYHDGLVSASAAPLHPSPEAAQSMRVFLTGASGYIGSAVADRLCSAGHELTGLARSDAAAKRLQAAGITPVRGDFS